MCICGLSMYSAVAHCKIYLLWAAQGGVVCLGQPREVNPNLGLPKGRLVGDLGSPRAGFSESWAAQKYNIDLGCPGILVMVAGLPRRVSNQTGVAQAQVLRYIGLPINNSDALGCPVLYQDI